MTTWFSREIAISPAELGASQLTSAHEREAALLLHTRGYVVLRQAIPPEVIAAAQELFGEVLADCVASRQGDAWYQESQAHQAVFWQRGARWRIFPKLRGPLADAWVTANPLAMQLVRQFLGDDCYCKFISSDTCVHGSELQSPHRELGCGGHCKPLAYIVNVPLVHCGLHNGPLEVWPGTHLWHNDLIARWNFDTDVQDGRNPEMEAFAADLPGVKLELRLGDLLVRDPGLLHRGTPNPTNEPRSMLTACFFRQGHSWDYGQAEFNLTAEIYRQLSPSVRYYFDYAFAEPPSTTQSRERATLWRRISRGVLRKAS